jgi:hypothetical protein
MAVFAFAERGEDELTILQAKVAARGAEVMPFDLDRTTHVFTKLPDGGVQTVTATILTTLSRSASSVSTSAKKPRHSRRATSPTRSRFTVMTCRVSPT